MKLINLFLERWNERRIQKFGKSCAKMMRFAALAMKYKYEGVPTTYAWLARQALKTRPNWEQVDELLFMYSQTGEVIEILEHMSLRDVVMLVINSEMKWILNSLPDWRQRELTLLAQNEADVYLTNGNAGSPNVAS